MASAYHTNPETREKIDTILKKASTMMANLGTKTPLDVGSELEAKKLEKQWLEEIRSLDLETYQVLVPRKEEQK